MYKRILSKCRKVSEEKSVGLLSIYTKQCDKSDHFIFNGHIALHLNVVYKSFASIKSRSSNFDACPIEMKLAGVTSKIR